ncbi:hypothetical protein Tco_0152974 [Tanacetum coccineum]
MRCSSGSWHSLGAKSLQARPKSSGLLNGIKGGNRMGWFGGHKSQRNKGQGRGGVKVINMMSFGGYQKRYHEGAELEVIDEIPIPHEYSGVKVKSVKSAIGWILGRSLSPLGDSGPLGRTGMRSLEAIGLTIHSMIKFPMATKVATLTTSKETLKERKEPMLPDELVGEDLITEPVVINGRLSIGCKIKIKGIPTGRTQGLKETMYEFGPKKGVERKGDRMVKKWFIQRTCTPSPKQRKSPYKCFLHPPKEGSQIRMSEEDKEMTSFHIDGGLSFHTLSKRLKNFGATYQRLMDMVFTKQRGRNVEACLEEIVTKS